MPINSTSIFWNPPKELPTSEDLNKAFKYNPDTGCLFWKINRRRIKAGSKAGYIDKTTGYIKVTFDGQSFPAHRIAWALVTGNWPENEIDHINGIRNDNRFSNLRDVSRSENQKNRRLQTNSGNRVLGVRWRPYYGKWVAYIKTHRECKHLGYFADWFEAVCARKSAEVRYGFHPNHGKIL